MAEPSFASFGTGFALEGDHSFYRALTRTRHDPAKMNENNDISTGPGRWAISPPNAYGNAAYVPNVTTIIQKWGASHIMTSTKTDVESDLLNVGRPSVRTACGQYQPTQGAALAAQLTPMPEVAFPQVASHLVDPPCTLRGSGGNRWQWLCENSQQKVMMPFEHLVDSRHAVKDSVYSDFQGSTAMVNSKIAADRQMLCGNLYVETSAPVAKPRGPNDPPNFNDAVQGSAQRHSMPPPPAHFTPTGLPPSGSDHPLAPPTYEPSRGGPPQGERERAATGVLKPPPPFTAYIAPH
jgi:hypothetical protein